MNVQVGDIWHVSELNIYPAKGKYAVCVSVEVWPVWVLLINTENRAHYDCIPLSPKEGRRIPVHESFISCKTLYDVSKWQFDDYHGQLDAEELQRLRTKIASSKFLTKVQINQVTMAIDGELAKRGVSLEVSSAGTGTVPAVDDACNHSTNSSKAPHSNS
jgi:hypothetical protein